MIPARNRSIAMALLFAAGIGLFASPWTFGFIDVQAPAFTSKILAAGLMLVGLGAYVELRDWALRGALVAGLCGFLTALLLGFGGLVAAAIAHGAAGALALFAAWPLWQREGGQASSAEDPFTAHSHPA